jgi:hypothetical protein
LEEKLEKKELNAKMRETSKQRMVEKRKKMVKLARMFAPYAKWGSIFLCLFIILYSIHSLNKNQALQAKVEKVELMAQGGLENLELKAENRELKENAELKVNYEVYPLFLANYFKWKKNYKIK